nr:hypothetical protein [Tanacetum cinerariifolium]
GDDPIDAINQMMSFLTVVVTSSQNWRDLPRDNLLVSVEVLRYDIKRSKSENKGIVSTEMELVLEQTQQGTSHEVSSTQQYGAILPIELTTDEIRNSKAYKEYYACAMGEAAPKPKASVRKKKDNDDNNEEDELAKSDEEDTETESEEESNDEEDQDLRLSEEARIQEEEDADELYRDVNINQGRGLQVTQNVEDTHATLTPDNPDGPQESSSMSSTSYAIAADLSEMELKKILIEKMEGNKSIQRSDEQRNLYKALVEAYEVDKAILDTYGDSTILKRRREDDAKKTTFTRSCLEYNSAICSRRCSILDKRSSKTKAADYGHIKWIEDLVPRAMWVHQPIDYNRHALWGVSHWGGNEHCHQEASGRPSTEVESYQKKLNLTKPDTYRPDLRRREAYTAHSNPRGFIYQNKDKKNRLMRIDELHKFSDGTLNDVRNTLDDRLKGIRMQYLSTTIWRRGDKERATAIIQAIDKMLKTRRIMRSLEKFVGGRLYE